VILIKNIAFQIDEEFHIKIKIQATIEGKSIKEYIIELINDDLDKKETPVA